MKKLKSSSDLRCITIASSRLDAQYGCNGEYWREYSVDSRGNIYTWSDEFSGRFPCEDDLRESTRAFIRANAK